MKNKKSKVTIGIPAYKRRLIAGIKNNISVTIGIPAYNEEANIGYLLKSLLKQKQNNYILEKIIVVSDGSDDGTVKEVRKVKDRRIKIIESNIRQGQAASQNIITGNTNSEILVLINADVLPLGVNFLENLIKPFLVIDNVGIVGADTRSRLPNIFFESVVIAGRDFKKKVYRKINNSSCVYLCHGRGRAFSKKLYTQIKWVDDCAEDSFSYFTCLEKDMKFFYCPNAIVNFRSPTNLMDHKKQSDRFFKGKSNLKKYFDTNIVDYEYRIPKKILLSEFLKSLLKNPFKISIFGAITLYSVMLRTFAKSTINKNNYSLWNVTASSKKL
jgi:glycosyltransferase involved in cell wall biosynthesis